MPFNQHQLRVFFELAPTFFCDESHPPEMIHLDIAMIWNEFRRSEKCKALPVPRQKQLHDSMLRTQLFFEGLGSTNIELPNDNVE